MFNPATFLALAATASAATQSAIVTIDSGSANTTITVPINTHYSNPALNTVKTLSLVGADGVALSDIICTPYSNDGTSDVSPFTSSQPSVSSNKVSQVDYLLCTAYESSASTTINTMNATSTLAASTTIHAPYRVNGTLVPSGTAHSTGSHHSNTTTSHTSDRASTTVEVKTLTGANGSKSTITSTAVISGSGSSASTTSAASSPATTTASPSLAHSAGDKVVASFGSLAAVFAIMAFFA